MVLGLVITMSADKKYLPACIDSLAKACDIVHIVINENGKPPIETGADGFKALVEKIYWGKDNIILHTFPHLAIQDYNDLSQVRNTAVKTIGASVNDFIITLDPDERLTIFGEGNYRQDMEESIEKAHKMTPGHAFKGFGGFKMRIINPHVFRTHYNTERHSFVRAFYPRPEFGYVRPIHESTGESIIGNGYNLLDYPGKLYIAHLGYDIPWSILIKKLERNMAALWKYAEANPEDGISWFHLGKSYGVIENWETAIACHEQAGKCKLTPEINRLRINYINQIRKRQEYEAKIGTRN